MSPSIRLVCALLFAATGLGPTYAPAASGTGQPPNIVLIVADDLGYSDLSAYGGDRYRTPHLDALAAGGVRFTDFHSNGPVCSPTRAALLTGRYQQRTGIDGVVYADPKRGMRDTHGLPVEETTFAERLREAGYRTGLVGKWHLGYARKFNPRHHGFDEFRGYVSGNIDFQSHVDEAGFLDWWRDLEIEDEPGYTTHLITRHALRFIEENRARPFCLYVAHEAPHYPYQGPADPAMRRAGRPAGKETYPPGQVPRAYREMMEEMDRGVGEIVAQLRRFGLEGNTLVFFCSDNGATSAGSNLPFRGQKGTLWEGGHRVPAMAYWPGTIAAGVAEHTAMTMDLMPTLLEFAGVESPAGARLDGVSLAPLLTKQQALPSRMLFWSYRERHAVRDGRWKLLAEGGLSSASDAERVQLFDLDADPGETRDRAADTPDVRARLLAALVEWRRDVARR